MEKLLRYISELKLDLNGLAERSPNTVGELLRNHFFDQSKGETGCYSTFDLRSNIYRIQSIPVELDNDLLWCRAKDNKNVIEMRYYWDGDGTLLFILPDLSVVVSTDCKKDYEWNYYNSYQEWLDY